MGLFKTNAPKPAILPIPRDEPSVAAGLRYAREADPIGHRVHTALAMVFAFSLPLSQSFCSISFALLAGYSVLRLWVTWRSFAPLLRPPMLYVLLLWPAWAILSLSWTPEVAQVSTGLGAMRMIAVPWMLWPVVDQIPRLICAFLSGVLVLNGRQLFDHLEWFGFAPTHRSRGAGLLHPIQTGAMCAAAMCWALSGIVAARGWWRGLATVSCVAAVAGLVASGSRGPWLAALIAVPAMLGWLAIRRPESRRVVALIAVLGAASAAIAWPFVGASVVDRARGAITEVRDAREDGVLWTSAGLRVGLWSWAWSVFESAPVRGVGAGGFRHSVRELPEFQAALDFARADAWSDVPGYAEAIAADRDPSTLRGHRRALRHVEIREDYLDRAHAHSTYLQTLACGGLIGAAILLAVLLLIARRCAVSPRDHAFADGNMFVLIVWLIGSQFDAYHLAGNLLGLLTLLVAIVMPLRPRLTSRATEAPPKAEGSATAMSATAAREPSIT